MELVLVHPEIPQNAGSVGRLAAATGVRLHLVEPLGFSLEDRYLKRAGLDYWPMVDLVVHNCWEAAVAELSQQSERPLVERLRLFSARGGEGLFETRFEADDLLVFGSESSGLPAQLLEAIESRLVYIPVRPGVRSLNIANAAAVALYTAMNSASLPLPDNDGTYTPDARAAEGLRPADVALRGGASSQGLSGEVAG